MISTAAAARSSDVGFTDRHVAAARALGRQRSGVARGDCDAPRRTCDARLLEVTLALGAEVMLLGKLGRRRRRRAGHCRSLARGRGERIRAHGREPRWSCRHPGKAGRASGEGAARRRRAGAARWRHRCDRHARGRIRGRAARWRADRTGSVSRSRRRFRPAAAGRGRGAEGPADRACPRGRSRRRRRAVAAM